MEVKFKPCSVKTFNVTIISRNKNSIYNFFLFFNCIALCSLTALMTYFQKNVNKKRLTLLTSPHVNKSAQEQFERRIFKKQLIINTTKTFRYLIFLKKLNYNVFSDINIKLKCTTSSKGVKKLGLKIFNLNCCKFNRFYSFKVSLFYLRDRKRVGDKKNILLKLSFIKKTTRLVKFLDLYGEYFKNMFE